MPACSLAPSGLLVGGLKIEMAHRSSGLLAGDLKIERAYQRIVEPLPQGLSHSVGGWRIAQASRPGHPHAVGTNAGMLSGMPLGMSLGKTAATFAPKL